MRWLKFKTSKLMILYKKIVALFRPLIQLKKFKNLKIGDKKIFICDFNANIFQKKKYIEVI
jgi:hypothetical protein